MAGLSHAQLESRYLNAAYQQLRSFDKTITISATAYYNPSSGSGQGTASATTRFEYVNAATSTYSTGDIPNRIGDNLLVVASDIQNFATNCISRTVNQIEGRITNRSFDFRICHSSCHYSCHASRGRR